MKRNGTIDDVTLDDLARAPPEVLGKLVRRDLRRAIVTVHTPDAGATQLLPVFDEVDRQLKELEARYPGYHCELTGTAVVAARNVYGIIDDAAKSLLLSSVVIIATMMIAFRSIRLGLICIVPTLFPVVAVAGGLALLGEPLRIVGAMTFSVCLGLADDNTVHLVSRFRQELALGRRVRTAVEHALGSSGPAMVIMTATLASGLLPTLWGGLLSTATIGALTIAALVASVIADLVILPPLLVCFVPEQATGVPHPDADRHSEPAAPAAPAES
jgi:predicted RND superfamily exporter protein